MSCPTSSGGLSIGVMQTAVFYCSRAVGRKLIAQGSGQVVNIASIRGQQGHPGRLAYCAAKAAVIMMTQVMGAEWGPLGVRVNAVAPGFIATAAWDQEVARGFYDEAAVSLRDSRWPAGHAAARSGSCVRTSPRTRAPTSWARCITIDGGMSGVPSG